MAHPWRIARAPNPKKGFLEATTISAGVVQAYVCRSCGYTEFYTLGPEQIPVDGEYVQSLTGPKPPDPSGA